MKTEQILAQALIELSEHCESLEEANLRQKKLIADIEIELARAKKCHIQN